jgi:hypothetical protein
LSDKTKQNYQKIIYKEKPLNRLENKLNQLTANNDRIYDEKKVIKVSLEIPKSVHRCRATVGDVEVLRFHRCGRFDKKCGTLYLTP